MDVDIPDADMHMTVKAIKKNISRILGEHKVCWLDDETYAYLFGHTSAFNDIALENSWAWCMLDHDKIVMIDATPEIYAGFNSNILSIIEQRISKKIPSM